MHDILLTLIALIWSGGTIIRVYRQARFYQIEEYKSNRYLRWWIARRERWFLPRTAGATFLGIIAAVIFSEAPNSPLPGILGVIFALIAVWPPAEGEIKKGFRRTQRASRLLAAAFMVPVVLMIAVTISVFAAEISAPEVEIAALFVSGFAVFFLAPLWLMIGNVIMYPVESFLRRLFIGSARNVMHEIHPTVIGITGSYGKTTTKNFIADILNGRFRAYPTPKSYNTMMGVCIAINNDLKDNYSIDHFIVEMGAYVQGEIRRISNLTPPDISVVVEVGPQHLERFGSLENIAIAKYEIIKALKPDGVGIFNWDNPYVRDMYEKGYPQTRIAVSKTISPDNVPDGGPRFIATNISESLDGLRFTVTDVEYGDRAEFVTPVVGEHNVTNILLATAVAVHQGMPLADVAFRVRTLQPAESRLVRQTTAQGITIINDAYSANPVGTVSALRVLGMHTTGRRLVVTPGMIELADQHEPENRKLGTEIAQYATDVILVGSEQTKPIKDGLQDAGFTPDHVQTIEELREAVEWYQTNLAPGDTVLFLNDLPDTY